MPRMKMTPLVKTALVALRLYLLLLLILILVSFIRMVRSGGPSPTAGAAPPPATRPWQTPVSPAR